MSNFIFLKSINQDLYNLINEAEKLYRDEYFEQCAIQTRRFAENVCKDLLVETSVSQGTFDEMVSYLSDKAEGHSIQKEFIDDLYFLKKTGNQSAHETKVKNIATTALECLQRAFEIGINYAIVRGISVDKVKSLRYDIDLLVTGKSSKKSLAEKYVEMQNEMPEILEQKPKQNNKKKVQKQSKIATKPAFQVGFVTILFSAMIFATVLMICAFIFFK